MRHHFYAPLLVATALLAACSSHYVITGIERTRILIDSTYDTHPDAAAAAYIAPYQHIVDSIMCPVVGTTARYMAATRPESTLSNLLADILLWAAPHYDECPAFAVYNMGGIRAALPQGTITYGDVLEVAPFDNKICFLSLRGDKVMELFAQIAHTGGEALSHGVALTISPTGTLLSARLHGEEIVADSMYRIATIDYVAEGNDYMTAFKEKSNYVAPADTLNNTRFLIMDYFRARAAQGLAVDATIEGRIVIKE